ncbi:MAG: KpsF/GutQ family sugar-phosphate isomerase [Candidatus Eisenbacteria bacterium]|nr:KpsF/GutQ family sugar-phosphate isomerase [Candidatus Eisenbacteria bacterium]
MPVSVHAASETKESLIRVLGIESRAIDALCARDAGDACRAVDLMYECRGKVVVAGTGKSGNIAQKVSSTLASTGTPSMFLRLSEATHGDIGMLDSKDVLMVISNSGSSPDFRSLLPFVRRLGIPIIALVGTQGSELARSADIVIDVSVEEEACPLGLVPTASSTAALAMGDALAIALLEKRGFSEEDYALRHPGGSLGRRLRRVDEIMLDGDRIPRVSVSASLPDVIIELARKRLGVVAVEEDGKLAGVFSNGDLARLLRAHQSIDRLQARDVMTREPKTIEPHRVSDAAVHLMQQHSITALFVVDDQRRIIGIVHLHDLLRAEIV